MLARLDRGSTPAVVRASRRVAPLGFEVFAAPVVAVGLVGAAAACSSPNDTAPVTTPATGGAGTSGGSGGTLPGSGGFAASPAGGTGAAGASNPGTGGAASTGATLIEPIERGNGLFALELQTPTAVVSFLVNATSGARVSGFGVDGQNLLTTADIGTNNWGSTFWPSPQVWSWPPDPAFDSSAYTAVVDRSSVVPSVVMTSQPANVANVGTFTVTKKFTPNLTQASIAVEYQIQNTGTAPMSAAGWEVTRVGKGGVTFFPAGDGILTSGLTTSVNAGIVWFQESAAAIVDTANPKLYADGAEGWLGHVAGNVLMVKSFPDVPSSQQARQALTGATKDEAEIEIYVNPALAYIEIEEQGPYATIQPGQGLSWTVTWYVAVLPQTITPSVDNADLVAFARSLVSP